MNAEQQEPKGDGVNIYVAYKQRSFHMEEAWSPVPTPRNEFCLETIWEEKANS